MALRNDVANANTNAANVNEDMPKPLSAEEITFYKTSKKVTEPRSEIQLLPEFQDKIELLKKKEAEEVLPIIIHLLLTIQATLQAEIEEMRAKRVDVAKYEVTLANLDKALLIFAETDRVTQAGEDAQKAYLKKLKDKAEAKAKLTKTEIDIFADLAKLVEDVKGVEITPNTKDLWKEVAVWLEGLYQHNAWNLKESEFDENNEPKKSRSKLKFWSKKLYYPCVDALDIAIFGLCDITKLEVSIHHHRASLALRAKLLAYSPEDAQVVSVAEAKPGAQYNMECLASDKKGFIKHRIRYKPECIPVELSMVELLDEMFSNPMGVALSNKVHLQKDKRIDDFERVLSRMPDMSNKLKSALSGFAARASAVIKAYINTDNLSYINPARFLPAYLAPDAAQKTHFRIATTALQELEKEERNKEANYVTAQLQIILKLYKDAKNGGSTTFMPALKDLLLDQIDIIIACKDAQDTPIEYHQEIIQKDSEGFETLEIDYPEDKAKECKIILDVIEGYISNPLGMELATMLGCNEETRIQQFTSLLRNKYKQLTPQQRVDFANFRQEAFESMKAYTDPSNYSWLNPARYIESLKDVPLANLLTNTHVNLVGDVQRKMRMAMTEKEHIDSMLDLRLHVQGQSSEKLYTNVTNFLVSFIDRIIPAHAYSRFMQGLGHNNHAGRSNSMRMK